MGHIHDLADKVSEQRGLINHLEFQITFKDEQIRALQLKIKDLEKQILVGCSEMLENIESDIRDCRSVLRDKLETQRAQE